MSVFTKWHVAYHGTAVGNVRHILDCGGLLLPGQLSVYICVSICVCVCVCVCVTNGNGCLVGGTRLVTHMTFTLINALTRFLDPLLTNTTDNAVGASE